MGIIYCSNKLNKFLGSFVTDPLTNPLRSGLGDWNGHLFFLDGKKCLALVNNQTYYSLFIADILKKDMADFSGLFLAKLIHQLIYDHVIDQNKAPFIKQFYNNLILTRTNNDKKTIGTMNDLILQFKDHRYYKYDNLLQMDISRENSLINDTFTKPTRYHSYGPYGKPKLAMQKLIEICTQESYN